MNSASMKLTHQIAHKVQNRIASGKYPCGSRIPSERILADEFGVNRATVRAAIELLVSSGRLKRVQGKGTFVMNTDVDDASIHFKGMCELLQRAGYEPSSNILRTQIRPSGYRLSRIFGIDENAEVFQITRLRSGNSRPISVENTFTLPSLINNIEQVDFQVYSLYDAFRMNHVSITRIDQKLSSSRARQSIARALDTEDGSAIMLIQITAHNQNDRVVEFTDVTVLPDFCRYYTDAIINNGVYSINFQGV